MDFKVWPDRSAGRVVLWRRSLMPCGRAMKSVQPVATPWVDRLVDLTPISDQHLIALPARDADGDSGLLAEANLRRLADATSRLEGFIRLDQLVPSDEPASSHGATVAARLDVTVDQVRNAVDLIARHDDLRPGRISFGLQSAADGIGDDLDFTTSYGISRPNLASIVKKAEGGAAIVVGGIDGHLDLLGSVIADLETIGGRPCSADAVLLPPGATHVEVADRSADVVLIPLDGPVSARVVSGVKTGECRELEVPSHVALIARAGRELSVTVADGMVVLIRIWLPFVDPWADLVGAARSSRFHPLLRADLPTSRARPIESYAGTVHDDVSNWVDEVQRLLSPRAFAHAAAEARAALQPRVSSGIGLLSAIRFRAETAGTIRSPAHGGVMVTTLDDELRLAFGGRIASLPPGVIGRLARYLDGRPHPADDVVGDLARAPMAADLARRLLVDLVEVELMEPVPCR